MPDTPVLPSLLERTVASLQNDGRLVKTDWDLETFDVLATRDGAENVLGVAKPSTGTVVFYYVWPKVIAHEYVSLMLEFVARANCDLYTSAFEFDPDSGIVSVRAGAEIGNDSVNRDAESAFLINALDEVERAGALYDSVVRAVGSGNMSAIQAASSI
ncbi:hypothetical protein EH165_07555 [Nakamurella antarctica]|uniref:Sensory transduction regulator n=1 Tax=Nakamurella antarctica TaxID=1902245 RepID=A0A3G8ZL24_9ACTN|nr:hypothetical protein [Nakamurella antarctica]AZI58019.1 hypothetical protein EH165_07555 [Nakamurella antarctica]